MIQGRQQLYDRLEECLEIGGQQSQFEINNIIAQLQLRSGSYGMERKNLINNLVKSMIDLAFPNIVKYLFWACDQDTGIFEELSEEDVAKFKRMSKYKKVEVACQDQDEISDDEK